MNKKSELLDSIRQNKFPDSQAKFKAKEARYNLKDCIILAKAKQSNHLAECFHDLSANPRDSLKRLNTLKEWIQGHHKGPNIIRFKKEDGSFIETDEEVVKSLSKIFRFFILV